MRNGMTIRTMELIMFKGKNKTFGTILDPLESTGLRLKKNLQLRDEKRLRDLKVYFCINAILFETHLNGKQ